MAHYECKGCGQLPDQCSCADKATNEDEKWVTFDGEATQIGPLRRLLNLRKPGEFHKFMNLRRFDTKAQALDHALTGVKLEIIAHAQKGEELEDLKQRIKEQM